MGKKRFGFDKKVVIFAVLKICLTKRSKKL